VASPAASPEAPVHSAVSYVVVYVVLLILTATTYITGTMHLGKWAILIALAIATIKASLVAIIFMHLRESGAATRLVFVTSLVFVALLLILTVSDVATRGHPSAPNARNRRDSSSTRSPQSSGVVRSGMAPGLGAEIFARGVVRGACAAGPEAPLGFGKVAQHLFSRAVVFLG
jgi:caa(3)-type oxidase subunit IV